MIAFFSRLVATCAMRPPISNCGSSSEPLTGSSRLMRPLASVDLQTGEPANALVERSDVSAVEALAVVAEAAVAWELARAAREKFGGDALGDFVGAWRAYVERI